MLLSFYYNHHSNYIIVFLLTNCRLKLVSVLFGPCNPRGLFKKLSKIPAKRVYDELSIGFRVSYRYEVDEAKSFINEEDARGLCWGNAVIKLDGTMLIKTNLWGIIRVT